MSLTFILTYVALSSAAFVMGRLLDQENRLIKLLSPSISPDGDLKEPNLDKLLSPSFKISGEADLPKVGLNHEVLDTLVQLSEKYPDREVQVQIEFNGDGKPKKLRKSMPARGRSGSRKIKRSRQPLQFGAQPVQKSGGLNIKDLFKLLGVKELRTVDGEVISADDNNNAQNLNPAPTVCPQSPSGNASPGGAPTVAAPSGGAPTVAAPSGGAPKVAAPPAPSPAVTPPADLIDEATRPVVMKDLWLHLGGNCVTGNCRPGAKGAHRGQGQQRPGQENGLDGDKEEYDDQANAAEDFIKMIREKVTVKRVSPKNQKTKWYKLMAGGEPEKK